MSREHAYRAAAARANDARVQLLTSASDAKARISRARLKQDVVDKVTGTVLEGIAVGAAKAQQRPVAVGAALGAFGLFLFRRPVTALFGRLYVRLGNPKTENSETDDG